MEKIKEIIINKKEEKKALKELLIKGVSIYELEEIMKNGKAEEWAMEEIMEFVEKEKKEEANIYIEAGKYYIDRDINKAIRYLQVYAEKGGGNEEVILLSAKLLKETGEIERARQVINSIKTENVEVLKERLNIAKEIKNTEEVIEIAEKIYEKEGIKEDIIEETMEEYIKAGKNGRLEEIIGSLKTINSAKIEYYDYQSSKKTGDKIVVIKKLMALINKKNKDINRKDIRNELINELTEEEKYINSDMVEDIIEILCTLVEEDDTDGGLIQRLGIILRRKELFERREKVIKILRKYCKESKKVRAGNIFLNEAEILERKIVLESKPRQMIIVLTTKCNLKCIMCNYSKTFEIDDECYEYIKSVIPYLEQVKWQGGEVFLYKNFKELVEFAGKYQVHQEFVTNGTLLTREIIELIAEYNIYVTFSIDAVEQHLYERIRVGAKFNKLLDNIKMLKHYSDIISKIRYAMISVVLPFNYNLLDKHLEFALLYGFQTISFQNYINYGNDELLLDDKMENIAINKIYELKNKRYPIIIDSNVVKNGRNMIRINYDNNFDHDKHIREKRFCFNEQNYDSVIEKYRVIEKKSAYAGSLLFCLSPWKVMCLYSDVEMRFACQSKEIKVAVPYGKLWNSADVLEYRKMILENDKTVCNAECYNNGEYSYKTRMGLL